MSNVLIYLDPDALAESLDLLGAADAMYGEYTAWGLSNGDVGTEAIGSVDVLVRVSEERAGRYDAAGIARVVEELHKDHRFDAILVPATIFGRMIAPRIAMRLHAGLVADVTEIRRRGERIELVRPAFSGRMLASIVMRGDGPVMVSVRHSVFSQNASITRETVVRDFTASATGAPTVSLIRERERTEPADIRKSDVLVSGGGGILRHFERLQALATALNGMVSASRRVVDSGAAPRHIQVGQSGKTVSPRLYIALGISGSIQHVVGVKNAEAIISVNTNRHAPICSISDIVVEGDAREFAERLTERILRGGMVPPAP